MCTNVSFVYFENEVEALKSARESYPIFKSLRLDFK